MLYIIIINQNPVNVLVDKGKYNILHDLQFVNAGQGCKR